MDFASFENLKAIDDQHKNRLAMGSSQNFADDQMSGDVGHCSISGEKGKKWTHCNDISEEGLNDENSE